MLYYYCKVNFTSKEVDNLKNRVQELRKSRKVTQQELADAVGVSRQTMNAIEKGDYNPTIRLCLAICKVLGKTLDELFWEEEPV